MTKSDVYQIVTDSIIEELEKGVVPWRKPWKSSGNMNLITRNPYRGFNVILTSMKGYSSPYWVSYKQAMDLGGHVRAGEKGTMITFWKWLDVEEERDGVKTKKRIPLLRYHTVFNVEQCDGLEGKIPAQEEKPELQKIEQAEEMIQKFRENGGPKFSEGGDRAFYRPSEDLVNLPKREDFESPEGYYGTAFHEYVHSTGAPSRLHRFEIGSGVFGDQEYSKEELVAEMGAAFLAGICGFHQELLHNSASYVASWLSVLRNDRRMLVHAAQAAQKAADLIMGAGENEEGEEVPEAA